MLFRSDRAARRRAGARRRRLIFLVILAVAGYFAYRYFRDIPDADRKRSRVPSGPEYPVPAEPHYPDIPPRRNRKIPELARSGIRPGRLRARSGGRTGNVSVYKTGMGDTIICEARFRSDSSSPPPWGSGPMTRTREKLKRLKQLKEDRKSVV